MPEGAGFNLKSRFIAGQAFCLNTGKLNFVNFRIFINYKNLTFRMLVGQHTPFMIIKIHGDVLVRSLLKRYVDAFETSSLYIENAKVRNVNHRCFVLHFSAILNMPCEMQHKVTDWSIDFSLFFSFSLFQKYFVALVCKFVKSVKIIKRKKTKTNVKRESGAREGSESA